MTKWTILLFALAFISGCLNGNTFKYETSPSGADLASDCGESCEKEGPDQTGQGGGIVGNDVPIVDESAARIRSRVTGTVRHTQVLNSMARGLRLQFNELSAATKDLNQSTKTNFPVFGRADEVSAPMMMSVLQLAGEVCNDLVTKERGGIRYFFPGLVLNGSSDDGSWEPETTVTRLAKSSWGRYPNKLELELLVSSWEASELTDDRTQASALFFCSSVLASAQAVEY